MANIYEAQTQPLQVESERLRSYDIPTQASIRAIGMLQPGEVLLDIGAGESQVLGAWAAGQSGRYVAYDIRHTPLMEQTSAGRWAVEGDARSLPFSNSSAQIAHARFVLAHFKEEDRRQIFSEAMRVVKPGGNAVFIDYDWIAMRGTDAVNNLRDFTLGNIPIFDAGFGARSAEELKEYGGDAMVVEEQRTCSPLLIEYSPMLSLQQVTLSALRNVCAGESRIAEAISIFADIRTEASLHTPPGFYMPDMVAIVVGKPDTDH